MRSAPGSSRRRYLEYRRRRKEIGRWAALDYTQSEDDAEVRSRRRRSRPFSVLFREFLRLLRGSWGAVAVALSTLTLATLIGLVLPISTKIAIDYILTDNPGPAGLPDWLPAWLGAGEGFASAPSAAQAAARSRLLWTLAGSMLILNTAAIGIHLWGRWYATKVTRRLQVGLRRRAFEHAVRLPLTRIHKIKSGGVPSLLRDDAGAAADLLFSMIYNPWRAISQLMGVLVILIVVDWRMVLAGLILAPTVWTTHKTWIARIRPIHRDIRSTRQGIDAHATESFGGMRVVRAFNREHAEATRFTVSSGVMARQEILAWWWSRIIDIAWQLLIPLASVGVLLYGGLQVVRGELTIGDVMMFTTFLLKLLGPMEVLANSATAMQNQLAGFDRVLDLLKEPREFEGSHPRVRLEPASVEGRISLRSVVFTYPGSAEPAIRGIDLDVPAGTTVALIGPSGAGKTTLCNLVARFYDPQQGQILLDGVDLRDIDADSYRRLLGVVEQDVFLFDGTVAENIGYSRRDASDADVRAAARVANADGFIERLEKGYDTIIGERGVRLSGGQKQRLAIARAVLADPKILILDEATSNLDTESEILIQRGLADLMRGRTGFVIAHRLSTIRGADLIVVIEHGRITETGTHDDLVARGGRYAELLRLQTEGSQLVDTGIDE